MLIWSVTLTETGVTFTVYVTIHDGRCVTFTFTVTKNR